MPPNGVTNCSLFIRVVFDSAVELLQVVLLSDYFMLKVVSAICKSTVGNESEVKASCEASECILYLKTDETYQVL